jgi:cobalt-zinc-cadmium efflux system membrane fusion protein
MRTLIIAAFSLLLAACGESNHAGHDHEHGEQHAEAFERGPHGGRMLREGNFAVEVTVFETNSPPVFRVYPYLDNKPADPKQVKLAMAVTRLGNKIDRFAFAPQAEYLQAQAEVKEPHSFDIGLVAEYGGKAFKWNYPSYEGRTTIARAAADAAGVKVEQTGPAFIDETIDLTGRVELLPEGRAEVRAWYPGRIVSMTKVIGDKVRKGETLARVESAASLHTYAIPSPFDGVVAERSGAPGGVAGDTPLYVVVDGSKLHAEFALFPQDAAKVKAGQKIKVMAVTGEAETTSTIVTILAPASGDAPMLRAHVEVSPDNGTWWPGMGVRGIVTLASEEVPLAVRTQALQRFRDFTVVYARVGDTYEVRMLELGRRTPEWTEVKEGIGPGEDYVTENAFLIRADIEKSGASHDH